jgi:malate dehydrogenase (oxaloacetate-decarboxylating)
MIDAGLEALAQRIPASRDPRAALMPALSDAAEVGAAVAEAVARAGVREGLAPAGVTEDMVEQLLQRARWTPTYSD